MPDVFMDDYLNVFFHIANLQLRKFDMYATVMIFRRVKNYVTRYEVSAKERERNVSFGLSVHLQWSYECDVFQLIS